jgi:hypothetical protein
VGLAKSRPNSQGVPRKIRCSRELVVKERSGMSQARASGRSGPCFEPSRFIRENGKGARSSIWFVSFEIGARFSAEGLDRVFVSLASVATSNCSWPGRIPQRLKPTSRLG